MQNDHYIMNEAFVTLSWIFLFVLFYSYLGYGILLYGLVLIKRLNHGKKPIGVPNHWPTVTHLIAAYNEEEIIDHKIQNSLSLQYPAGKMKIVVITDGSDDDTPQLVSKYPNVQLLHQPQRKGKIAAVHRAMEILDSNIIIFSDANTLLNDAAIQRIARHFASPDVGVVAGEKRVITEAKDTASAAGESLYWKYESTLKQWDGEWYSTVGAAGELFGIRRELYHPVPKDSIIEDFVMTLTIAMQGYRIAYEPGAYAMETASSSVAEEMKRKVRISAGAVQAMIRLKSLLNPLKYGKLSFQYWSHRVLRWTLGPIGLLFLFFSLPLLALSTGGIYSWMAGIQLLLYLLALLGWILEKRELRMKALFVPYYFVMMNLCVIKGWIRFANGRQSVLWERAGRKATTT